MLVQREGQDLQSKEPKVNIDMDIIQRGVRDVKGMARSKDKGLRM
jgi:hypothetical protein